MQTPHTALHARIIGRRNSGNGLHLRWWAGFVAAALLLVAYGVIMALVTLS